MMTTRGIPSAIACALLGCAAFAYTPVELDWKFEGFVEPEAVSVRAGDETGEMTLAAASRGASNVEADGLEEMIFRSYDFGEAEADIIKRYPPSGLFIYVR